MTTKTLFSDQHWLYALRRVRGYSYRVRVRSKKDRRKKKWVRRRVIGYSYLVRVGKIPRVSVKRRAKERRAVARKLVLKKAPRAGRWISSKQWLFDLQRQYGKFDLSRSSLPRWSWALPNLHAKAIDKIFKERTEFAFLSRVPRLPPFGPKKRYVSAELFYVIALQDEEDDRPVYLLWARRHLVAKRVRMKDIFKHISRREMEDLTQEELQLRLPVHLRVRRGALFKDALAYLPGFLYKDLQAINSLDYAQRQTVFFVGFAFYTEKKR